MSIKKILVVDDERLIRLTTSILLKQRDYEVIEAVNGEEGLKKITEEKPDLILLDIMMPYMDGWQVYDKMMENDEIKNIPVVIFTAGDYIASEQIARNKGIRWIIRKPFNIEILEKIFSEIDKKGE